MLQSGHLVGLGAAFAAVVALFYFDYRRLNSPDYHEKLRAKRKEERAQKLLAAEKEAAELKRKAMLEEGPIPFEPSQRLVYLQQQLEKGQGFFVLGNTDKACIHLGNAVRASDSPIELFQSLQRSFPVELTRQISALVGEDMLTDTYFTDAFPPRELNLGLHVVCEPDNKNRSLCTCGDLCKGAEIFEEEPIVCILDAGLDSYDYCFHCLRFLSSERLQNCPKTDRFYCSQHCQEIALQKYEFWLDQNSNPEGAAAYKKLARLCGKNKRNLPLLVVKLVARLLNEEDQQALSEYLSHLDVQSGDALDSFTLDKELDLIVSIFSRKKPEIVNMLVPQSYSVLLSKLKTNSVKIEFGSKPSSSSSSSPPPLRSATFSSNTSSTSSIAATNSSFSLTSSASPSPSPQCIGLGLYLVASFADHSCVPNMEKSFPSNNSHLHFVALKNIKQGDRILYSYSPVRGNPKWKRQQIIAEHGFVCQCDACKLPGN